MYVVHGMSSFDYEHVPIYSLFPQFITLFYYSLHSFYTPITLLLHSYYTPCSLHSLGHYTPITLGQGSVTRV